MPGGVAEEAEQQGGAHPGEGGAGGDGTSRPSTNESDAASSQTAAGAANGKRRRPSSGSTISATAGTANQSDVVGPRVVLVRATSNALYQRREHDQGVDSVLARKRPEPAHELNVLQALALRVLPE